MGRDGYGLRLPHVPRARAPLDRRGRVARHAHGRAGGVVPDPLARGRSGYVALPLPRRGPHDARDDRDLSGEQVRRLLLVLAAAALMLVAMPSSAAVPVANVYIQFAAYGP